MLHLLLFLGLAGAVEPPEPEDHAAHSVWVWQGFSHVWERRVLGLFTVPHRVSVFQSSVSGGTHTIEGQRLVSEGTFALGQSTGVDGDRMAARGFASVLHAPGIWVERGELSFETTDAVVETDRGPRADATFHDVLRFAVPAGVQGPWTAAVILQGVEFHSRCEGAKEDCNSDGVWPYRFRVELGACEVDASEATCPVDVVVGRAWTPGHGGIRGIEVKPLNENMVLQVEVAWAAILGSQDVFVSQGFPFENSLRSTQEIVTQTQELTIRGLSQHHSTATVALTALAFEFFPTRQGKRLRHRGRYVGGWGVRVDAGEFRQSLGELDGEHAGGIFLPRTVQKTGVSLSIGMAILQVEDPGAFVSDTVEVVGELCANSSVGAPWFSRWKRCEVEQIEVERPLYTSSELVSEEDGAAEDPEVVLPD